MEIRLLKGNLLKTSYYFKNIHKEYTFPFLEENEYKTTLLCLTGVKAGEKIVLGSDELHKVYGEWMMIAGLNSCKIYKNIDAYNCSKQFHPSELINGIFLEMDNLA